MAWEDKIARAVFTGNMKTSPNRQQIFHQAPAAAPPRHPPRRPGTRRARRRAHSAPAPGARAFTGRTPRLSARAAAALLSPPQAEQMPELLFVNEVYIKTSPPSCFAINEPNVTKGGTLVKKCGLSFEEMCRCHERPPPTPHPPRLRALGARRHL